MQFLPISPPVYVFSKSKKKGEAECHTVFGWFEEDGILEPAVGAPDGGPGVKRWSYFHGTDPWYAG